MRFIEARHFTPGTPDRRRYDRVVLHTMENQEKPGTAIAVGQWFHGETAPEASSHFGVDSETIVQYVRLADVAWAAPGCNSDGIQIEHAGRAGQSGREWVDVYSALMLDLSARLCAELCDRFSIPVFFVNAERLIAGDRGITTHAAVSIAFRKSMHWDPGPAFPMDHYLSLVDNYSRQTIGEIR